MSLENATVIGKRILVLPKETEEVTKSGIILTEGAQERPQLGTIVLVGSEVKYINKKDTVMHGKYAGTEIEIEDKKYLIMEEKDVLIVYKGE